MGFYPTASTAHVVQFDKTTGALLKDFMEPSLAGTWGGDYWVFLIRTTEASTTVYQIDGATGAIKGTTPASGRTIVGAGVSTCAPTVIL